MKTPRIKTLLFDLDGTLVDSRADLTSAVNHALVSTGHPAQNQSDIVPHVGNGLRVLLSEVLGPVSDEVLQSAISHFSEFYDEHCVDETVLYRGVKESLRDMHPVVKLGVVTNKPYHFAGKILRELGVADYISVVVGGDSLPEKKPHPAPLLKAVNDVGGTPDASLMLGDGLQDIIAGQAAGVKTCVARYGYGFHSGILELKPDFGIDDFIEIKEIVL